MSSFLYKGHSIICGAALDESTGRFVPTGQFVWYTAKGKFGTYSFTLSKLFDTRDDAKAVAASEAISPLDQRLQPSGA
jgi:hypothetical protein